MKRLFRPVTAAAAVFLALGCLEARAVSLFEISFPFKAAGKNFPAGDYILKLKEDGSLALRRESTGTETVLPFTEKMTRPDPPDNEPRLVFHMVGDFKPSYSEYVTVTILAEVWLPGQDGLRLHTTKGAHKEITVKGTAVETRGDEFRRRGGPESGPESRPFSVSRPVLPEQPGRPALHDGGRPDGVDVDIRRFGRIMGITAGQ